MLKGLGVDLVYVPRIKKMINRWEDKFLQRVYTDREIEYCRSYKKEADSFAVRFAAKEAILKMLGTGLSGGVSWREMEILSSEQGQPSVNLTGEVLNTATAMQINKIYISLSHENDYALAQVMGTAGRTGE